jgi:hypothetical protein
LANDEDKPSWERERTITEVKLYEGSSVLWGANPDTPFLGFKNTTPEIIKDQLQSLNRVLRNNAKLSDEAFKSIQVEIENLTLTLKAMEPEPTTSKTVKPREIINILENYKPKF